MKDQHDPHDQHVRNLRTTLPDSLHKRLAHASTDLGIPRHELMREAIVLLLHHLGRGDGIRSPNLPEKAVA